MKVSDRLLCRSFCPEFSYHISLQRDAKDTQQEIFVGFLHRFLVEAREYGTDSLAGRQRSGTSKKRV